MKRRFLIPSVAVALPITIFLWIGLYSHRQGVYAVTNLGIHDTASTYVYALNAAGQAVGYRDSLPGKPGVALLYRAGRRQELDPRALYNQAYSLNASGTIVGSIYTRDGHLHAARFDGHSILDLGTLGGRSSEAYAVNAQNQIVGTSLTGKGQHHAFLYSQGVMQNLGTLGGQMSDAQAINDQGEIVGSAQTNMGLSHAFLYRQGVMQDLGTLGGDQSDACAINQAGQVAGYSDLAGGATRAFLYHAGVMQELGTLPGGTLSYAYGVNAHGEVVGSADTGTGEVHAFLFTEGRLRDLNHLISPGSGWVLEEARAINDRGQIVGMGRLEGKTLAFLLEPK